MFFRVKEVRLLQYVNNRGILNLSKLSTPDFICNLYRLDVPDRHQRIDSMLKAWNTKVSYLYRFQNGSDLWKSAYKT